MKGTHIPQIVQRYVDHDMIKAHTELPELANTRVALMYAFLYRNQGSIQISELIAVVTSLVQLGLDTHDRVELAGIGGEDRNMRSRQLKVLAGDFFSSRYYHLLAQAGQVDAIRSLSQAVCEVNRLKMTAVERLNSARITADTYLTDCVMIKQCVFRAFDDWMLEQDIPYWEKLIKQAAYEDVLLQELERTNHFQAFEGSWAYWYIAERATTEERALLERKQVDASLWKQLIAKYAVSEELQKMMQQQQERYEELLKLLPKDLHADLGFTVQNAQPYTRIHSITGATHQA